jgi:hypothetical protein
MEEENENNRIHWPWSNGKMDVFEPSEGWFQGMGF